MKKTTKVLLTLACAVLLVAASVMGTLAYLTDKDTVQNTFTVGQVHIKLDEKDVKKTDGSRTEEGNEYHLLPGHTYDKDPTVTVLKGSDESYVRMLVTYTFDKVVTDEDLFNVFTTIIKGFNNDNNNNWTSPKFAETENKTKTVGDDTVEYTVMTIEYRYKTTVSAKDADKKLEPLFTGIEIPDTWGNAEMETFGNFKIDVVAQAIQASGFVANETQSAADVAWAAFDAQHPSQSTT